MKRIIILFAVVLTLAGAASAQFKASAATTKAITALEKSAWEGFIKSDGKFFQRFLSSDFTMIGDQGIGGKAESVKMISAAKCTVNSYAFSDVNVKMLDATTAVIAYTATEDGQCGGQPLPKKLAISSVFVKRGGRWLGAVHQETPMM